MSFHASLEHAESFKDFFTCIDALIPLEWKIDITVFGQSFCCGASPVCNLPNLSEIKNYDGSLDDVQAGLDFAVKYFHHVSTLDDLLVLSKDDELYYNFYTTNSCNLHISSLNNANIVRIAPLLLGDDMNFKGIDAIKISSKYIRNVEITSKVIETIFTIHAKVPIASITIAYPTDEEIQNELEKLKALTNVEIRMISEQGLFEEENNNHDDNPDAFEFWEEHTLYLTKDKFFLTKHDALHASNTFYTINGTIDPKQFVYDMVKRKIDMYNIAKQHVQNKLQKKYYTWVTENVIINEGYNWIPSIMYDPNIFCKELVKTNKFMETPAGIIQPSDKIVPLFESIK